MESNLNLFSADVDKQEIPSFHFENRGTISNGQEATVIDKELFIRHAFISDPHLGVELLYRHYFQPLCSHAVRMLHSQAIAEDLVSEIFYQLYADNSYKKIKTSYRAYLYKAVRNRALNYKRDEGKYSHDLNRCSKFSDNYFQRPDALAEYEELYNCLENGMNLLPTQRRRIFLMHRFENKKYSEIAEELHLSTRTVEVQIRKASLFLRALISKFWALAFFLLCF